MKAQANISIAGFDMLVTSVAHLLSLYFRYVSMMYRLNSVYITASCVLKLLCTSHLVYS